MLIGVCSDIYTFTGGGPFTGVKQREDMEYPGVKPPYLSTTETAKLQEVRFVIIFGGQW